MKRGIVFTIALCAWFVAGCTEEVKVTNMINPELTSDGQTIHGSWSVGRDLVTGDINKMVSLQAEFPPGDYTIQFNLEVPVANLGAADFRAVAFITWSVKGNQVTRRVNIGNGVSVSGNAEAVRIVMMDSTDRTGTAPPGSLGLTYNVTATVTKGTRPSVEQPPILMPFPGGDPTQITLTAGGIASFPVPQDAGAISVLVTVSSPTFTPIPDQRVIARHVGLASFLASYDPRAFSWVPLAPGTQSVDVQLSGGVVPDVSVQCYFGIDG